MYENGLIKELRLISIFFSSQAGLQLITIHVLSNISESKYSETIKFCHIIEYNVRNCDSVVLEIIWITNSSDRRRVWTANLLHTKELSNPGLG